MIRVLTSRRFSTNPGYEIGVWGERDGGHQTGVFRSKTLVWIDQS